MKFAIFFNALVKLPDWWLGTMGEYEKEDSFSLALHHWLCFMAMMGEEYARGPGSQTHHLARRPADMQWIVPIIHENLATISSLSPATKGQFRASLSEAQLRAWEVLRDWWDGAYQDAALSAAARKFMCLYPADPDSESEEIESQLEVSDYHGTCWCLWRREFGAPQWDAVIRSEKGAYAPQSNMRQSAEQHALGQKAGFLVLHDMRPEGTHPAEGGLFRYGKALANSCGASPWLPQIQRGRCSQDPDELPLYLWDREAGRTRKVSEVLQQNIPAEYTCVSHTWGRWKKTPSSLARLQGVAWAIPENTLFEITDLPGILALAPVKTRFLWFDLVCLPQDTTSPQYISEVGRQATIFYHASACLAWFNQVETWHNTQASLRWLALNYLHAGSTTDIYQAAPLLREIEKTVECGIVELRDAANPHKAEPWLTSTWTLQESSLCPDIIFCNRRWQPLELVPGTTMSLYQLNTLFSADRFASGGHARFERFRTAEAQLRAVQVAVAGPTGKLCRCAILDLGARRACQGRRAEAVMSALGATDWYRAYQRGHGGGGAPPDGDLLLGSYTLPFVREVAAKMGAEFFMSSCTTYDEGAIWPPEYRGTFLPFGRPENDHGLLAHVGLEQFELEDHPAVGSWSVEADASVTIPEASVLMDSRRYPGDLFSQLEGHPSAAGAGQGRGIASLASKFGPQGDPRHSISRLWKLLHDDQPPDVVRLAVVLARGPRCTVVAGLQAVRQHECGDPQTRWIRIFTEFVHASLDIPGSKAMNLVVL